VSKPGSAFEQLVELLFGGMTVADLGRAVEIERFHERDGTN